MDCTPPGSRVYGIFPGKNTGVGCRTLLQGIFPTQGSNRGLPHCRWIFYHLSHQVILWFLRIILNLLCSCSINGATKPGWQNICLQHDWLNILSPLLRHRAQKKRFLSKYYCLLTMHLVTQELWWKCTTSLINVVFMPSNTVFIL